MKAYKVLYVVFSVLIGALALIIGGLCFIYNRVPEGLIIIGSVFSCMTILYIIKLTFVQSSKDAVQVKAGPLLAKMECNCRFNQEHGVVCVLEAHTNGIVIESDVFVYELISYSDIEYVNGDSHMIELNRVGFEDESIYKFVSNSALKIKAMQSVLIANCAEDVLAT